MARESWSPIARVDSQLIPRLKDVSLKRSSCKGIDKTGHKVQSFGAAWIACDDELVTRQRLTADDLAQVVCKVLEGQQAAGLRMEMHDIEAPAAFLATIALTH